MSRKFYTLDDLKMFCKTNNFHNFNVKQYGAPIIAHSIETFESSDNSKDGLLDVKLKSCHICQNRNGSFISEENMNAYKSSFKGRPILGSIIKTDKGTYEFHSHDMTIDEEGNLEYVEQPIGVISQLKEPYLEYDAEQDKTYLMVEGHIFEDYSKAAEILQRHKTCRCSVEIAVEEMSYNANDDYLSIDKFSFRGVTILGYEQDGETEVLEGMEGSRITIDSFSEANNSVFSASCQEKLIETLEKLNETLSMFTINNANQEEVSEKMGHFEELLEKYGIERESVDFEFEGLSDEELDTIFEEKFGNSNESEETTEEVVEEEFEEGSAEELTEEDDNTDVVVVDESVDETNEDNTEEFELDDVVISFKISHEDVRYGIQNLLNAMNGDGAHYYVAHSVYDGFFYYEDWMNNDAFKQSYKMRKDVISFSGDPIPVFREFVTQEEKDELETMRKNYAALKEFKENYDASVLKAEKDEVFGNVKYSVLKDNEQFKQLKQDAEKFSVDEIRDKCKIIFADHVMESGEYSASEDQTEKPMKKLGFDFSGKPKKAQAYGGLFDE